MPRFVLKASVVEAVHFDGSIDSAVRAAQAAKAGATLTFPDGKPELLVEGQAVPVNTWFVAADPASLRPFWVTEAEFAERYLALDDLPAAVPASSPASAPKPRTRPRIDVGDLVKDTGLAPDDRRFDEVLEVLEVRDDMAFCDGSWGSATIPVSRLKPADPADDPTAEPV